MEEANDKKEETPNKTQYIARNSRPTLTLYTAHGKKKQRR
jgi:hypothetical protein